MVANAIVLSQRFPVDAVGRKSELTGVLTAVVADLDSAPGGLASPKRKLWRQRCSQHNWIALIGIA